MPSRSLEVMEQWRASLLAMKEADPEKNQAVSALLDVTSGNHLWAQVNHPRPTFCNCCGKKLSGVPWHGWACEVCKMRAHKKCIDSIKERCKWTIEASIPQHLQYISPENSIVPHQWVEGNLPMSSKCVVCEKVCGSVLKLQDWRCVWCACCVHDSCLSQLGRGCSLGPTSLSVLPPLAVSSATVQGVATLRADAAGGECGGGSPLLVLVNSKSGDNQGQRMIRKFKRLLNPLQVFDIIATGPDFALSFFEELDQFRVLVCGGDGTVGWVLGAFDRLNLHAKCQLAVLPLGTGNDLARVLGWGHAFYDDTQLPQLLRTFERAHTKMLDRWSVMAIEGPQADALRMHEQDVTRKVAAVLRAEQPSEIIPAAKSLCETVRNLMKGMVETFNTVEQWEREAGKQTEDPIAQQVSLMLAKLDRFMNSLGHSTSDEVDESGFEPEDDERTAIEERNRRDSLVGRANSLKKTIKEMVLLAERGMEQHYKETGGASTRRERFRKKRSRTTPSALKVSSSNLSSSSACSPPASPSPAYGDRLGVEAWSELSQTSGYGVSPTLSSNAGASPSEMLGDAHDVTPDRDVHLDDVLAPCIGRVQPPTPGGTREHSTAEGREGSSAANTRVPDRPSLPSERLFKPQSECQLYSQSTSLSPIGDTKLSHSDSSIYEHSEQPTSSKRKDSSLLRHVKHRKRSDAYSTSRRRSLLAQSEIPGGSLIAEILLLNAKVLSMKGDDSSNSFDEYRELKVMNNYFGIGLDAKIALEFHNKREESDKTRSRSKLFMWYGMLGGKELMHRTYRNLDQRIRLECDGVPVDLPSLQGIVILNIPSYSGGANFWGSAKDDGFTVQSFDDKILEVVALFGVIHVATSRVPNVVRLQNHRIKQCRHVRIVILGNEPIPVQVDGEPWLQPPGILQIVHKNRAQLLVRNPAFDVKLKKWEEQKERSTAPSTPTATSVAEDLSFPRRAAEFVRLVESEMGQLGVSKAFLKALEEAATAISKAEQLQDDWSLPEGIAAREEIVGTVEVVADLLEDHFGWPEHGKVPAGQPRLGPAPHFSFEVHGDEPDPWRYVLSSIRQEMSREEAALREERMVDSGVRKKSRLTDWLTRKWRRRGGAPTTHVSTWSTDDVAVWLGSIGLSQYSSQFKSNDIRGMELVHLGKSDILEMGVRKIGHVKRIQSAINEICEKSATAKDSRRSGRKGNSLSVERGAVPDQPSMSSI